MALGYCPECDELMTIIALGQQWGTRQVDWAPADHRVLTHRGTDDDPCGARVFEYEVDGGTSRFNCVTHGDVFPLDALYAKCPGSRKPIR